MTHMAAARNVQGSCATVQSHTRSREEVTIMRTPKRSRWSTRPPGEPTREQLLAEHQHRKVVIAGGTAPSVFGGSSLQRL